MYAGVDSVANRIINDSRWIPGALLYRLAPIRAIATWKAPTYTVCADGVTTTVKAHMVVLANSGAYGRGLQIVPPARLDDGLLDVMIVGDGPRRAVVSFMHEAKHGTHINRPEVSMNTAREVTLSADRPLPVCGDGDELAHLPVTVWLRPRRAADPRAIVRRPTAMAWSGSSSAPSHAGIFGDSAPALTMPQTPSTDGLVQGNVPRSPLFAQLATGPLKLTGLPPQILAGTLQAQAEFVVGLLHQEPAAVQLMLTAGGRRLVTQDADRWIVDRATRVTVPVGATMAMPAETADDLVDRADRFMYTSKQGGRNRVTTDADALNG